MNYYKKITYMLLVVLLIVLMVLTYMAGLMRSNKNENTSALSSENTANITSPIVEDKPTAQLTRTKLFYQVSQNENKLINITCQVPLGMECELFTSDSSQGTSNFVSVSRKKSDPLSDDPANAISTWTADEIYKIKKAATSFYAISYDNDKVFEQTKVLQPFYTNSSQGTRL